ncbi:16S rRNA (guanine(527)-N(7))-methyltransferase RsmG [Consotaella salsifontis]|uniref:Ribosomal RNA small subunit methyltransferase G n=1 Tax=Consotaella salsifontis TaxID=1365950 RepID=A0A1T4T593_9HYPH|nr:16S rRNA (guanine(527)-N(7))-methyltransferase RsmG [Consotaella salsifontis]SKA35479.1 16S rRNA m(7)G-527 methyltransferase [Consotaella salsifontis]
MPLKPRHIAAADSREREAVLANVSRETAERIDLFVALLLKWQQRINLIAPASIPSLWTRHVADGLALAQVASAPARWLDLGSGGGFPGIVLAIATAGRPGAHVDLIESNGKKAAFLRAALAEAGVSGTVHCRRIEECGGLFPAADAVSARALASLDHLLALVQPHLPAQTPCFFLKGQGHLGEIAEASAHWRFTMVKHPSAVEAGAVILEVSDVRPFVTEPDVTQP